MLNKLLMLSGGCLVGLVCYIAIADGGKINKERRTRQIQQELIANATTQVRPERPTQTAAQTPVRQPQPQPRQEPVATPEPTPQPRPEPAQRPEPTPQQTASQNQEASAQTQPVARPKQQSTNTALNAVGSDGGVDFKQILRSENSAGKRVITSQNTPKQEAKPQPKPQPKPQTTAKAEPKKAEPKPQPKPEPQVARQEPKQNYGGSYGESYESGGSGVRVTNIAVEANRLTLSFAGEVRRDFVSFRPGSGERTYVIKNAILNAPYNSFLQGNIGVSVKREGSNRVSVKFTGASRYTYKVIGQKLEFTVQ